MGFITQEKTNTKYILIIFTLALIVGGGTLWWQSKQGITSQGRLSNEHTVNWGLFTDQECGYEIRYPSGWKVEKNCVPGINEGIACIKSGDFEGQLGVPYDEAKQGIAITITCTKLENEISVEEELTSCLKDKQEYPSVGNICELVKAGKTNFLLIEPNHYIIISGKVFYNILTIMKTTETPVVINQILSTFRFLD